MSVWPSDKVPLPPISPVSTIQIELLPKGDALTSKPSDDEALQLATTVSAQAKKTAACLAFIMFIVSIDSTILTATLPTVADALQASSTEAFWIATSYLLASAVCQPVMMTMADICGRTSVTSTAILMFSIGSAICSIASTVSHMLIGRTIQGVGGGGIMSLNLIVLSDLIPLRKRSTYIGLVQLVFGFGTSLAPVLGAVLAEKNWRWLFYINLPFCGIALVAVPLCLRQNPPVIVPHITARSADWIGMVALVSSITSTLIGLSWGGTSYPWRSLETLLPITFGCLGVIATLVYEVHLAPNPFLRKSLFKNRSAIIGYSGTLLQGITLFALSYFVPTYLLACKLYSPTQTGLAMLPLCLTVVTVSGLTGALITRVGSYRWAVWMGWTLTSIGLPLLGTLSPSTPTAVRVAVFFCAGAGLGMLLIGHSVVVQASVSEEDAAHAANMYCFVRSLGLALALPIGKGILVTCFEQKVQDLQITVETELGIEVFIANIQHMDAGVVQLQLRQAFAWALQRLWVVMASSCGFGLFCSAWIRHATLNR